MPRTAEGVGWKARDTAARAAHGVSPKAVTLRDRVLQHLRAAVRPLTSEEIAERMGEPYPSIQPRLSELSRLGLVRDSGTRKIGRYGKPIIAWEVAEGQD